MLLNPLTIFRPPLDPYNSSSSISRSLRFQAIQVSTALSNPPTIVLLFAEEKLKISFGFAIWKPQPSENLDFIDIFQLNRFDSSDDCNSSQKNLETRTVTNIRCKKPEPFSYRICLILFRWCPTLNSRYIELFAVSSDLELSHCTLRLRHSQ